MPTVADLAPDLAVYLDIPAAVDMGSGNVPEPPPPPYKTLADLTPSERDHLFTWLKWRGKERKPIIPAVPWLESSPKQVAELLWMDLEYVRQLIRERDRIESEVLEWGADAFTDHPVKVPVISSAVVDVTGNIKITGTDFVYGTLVSRVRFIRAGSLLVAVSANDIAISGGSVTDTEIVVPSSLAAVQPDDHVLVRVNATNSNRVTLQFI